MVTRRGSSRQELGQAFDGNVIVKKKVAPGQTAQVGLQVAVPAKLARLGELDGEIGRPVWVDIVLRLTQLLQVGYASGERFSMDSR